MMPAWVLSFCSGFLSLSLEVLWVRLFSFAHGSLPQAFALVLVCYLIGISVGAWLGKYYCENKADLWRVSASYLFLASLIALVGPWIYVATIFSIHDMPMAILFITLTAGTISVVFPIAHHLGTPTSGAVVGRSLSYVYVANIMGATLGPIFAGIFLLAFVTTQQAFFICGALAGLLSICCYMQKWRRLLVCSVWTGIMLLLIGSAFNSHLLIANSAVPGAIRRIIENQYGIVISYFGKRGGDTIRNGNLYDGKSNLDPLINSNNIHRVLILSALHPAPKRVLIIGLSVGSWLALVNTFPHVTQIDVVEINPGYLKLMQDYPQHQRALQDPRVHLSIDDGRRWLKAHPDNRYDLVIMNTTFHWRAYSTSLLSREFLTIVKHHMNPGAILSYNPTSSLDAMNTALVVWKHAYSYGNSIIAADFDWRLKLQTPLAVTTLAGLRLEGKPLFPKDRHDVIHFFLNLPVRTIEELRNYHRVSRKLEVITDRNLITEYKYGIGLMCVKGTCQPAGNEPPSLDNRF